MEDAYENASKAHDSRYESCQMVEVKMFYVPYILVHQMTTNVTDNIFKF